MGHKHPIGQHFLDPDRADTIYSKRVGKTLRTDFDCYGHCSTFDVVAVIVDVTERRLDRQSYGWAVGTECEFDVLFPVVVSHLCPSSVVSQIRSVP